MQYSSVLTLVALSVDRCLATYPSLAHLRRIAVGVGVCAAVWAASLLGAGTPYAAFSGVVAAGRRRRSCRVRWPWSGRVAAQRAWTYGHLLVGVVVPLALIAAANALLVRRLRSLAGYSTSLRRTPAAADPRRSTRQNAADESWSARRQRASHSMARLVLAIVVIFVVCQLPYHIIEVLRLPAALPHHRGTSSASCPTTSSRYCVSCRRAACQHSHLLLLVFHRPLTHSFQV